MKKSTAANKFTAAIGLLFLLLVFSASQTAAQNASGAASGPTDQQLLKEIVAELKQLRSTIARTNVNQVRFQTAFDQFKLQQSRVDMLTREMDSIKNQLGMNSPFRASSDEMIKMTEERLLQTTDPRLRQSLERQIQTTKRNVEMQEQREKRMKERQTALEMQMPMEQAKLDQLNMEIERIKQDINALLNQ